MKKNESKRKYYYLGLIIAVVLSVIFELLYFTSLPKVIINEKFDNNGIINTINKVEMLHKTVKDEKTGESSDIYYVDLNNLKGIKSFRINFSDKVSEDVFATLIVNEEFSKDFGIKKGLDNYFSNASLKNGSLRIEFKSKSSIKNIELSNKPLSIFYFNQRFSIKRFSFICCFFVLAALLAVKLDAFKKIRISINDFYNKYKPKFVKFILLFCILNTILLLSAFIILKAMHLDCFKYIWPLIITVSLLLSFYISYIKLIAHSPECFFAITALSICSLFSVCLPISTNYSWDDQIHYSRAATVSYFGNKCFTDSDNAMRHIVGGRTLTFEQNEANIKNLNSNNQFVSTTSYGEVVNTISFIGSLPSAAGIVFARMTRMSFEWIMRFGRLFNAFFYILMCYLAIKKLKSGKVLLTALSLLPTTLFIASNYSYDPFMISLLIFGFSYFYSIMQDRNALITRKDAVIIISSLFLGICVKQIYFCLLLLLLFVPKEKFTSKRFKKYYNFAIITAVVILIVSFALPFFVQVESNAGDIRGGVNVNPSEQIQFIFSQPLKYTGILLSYLVDYLSLMNFRVYTIDYAYLGYGGFGSILIILFAFLILTDKNESDFYGSKLYNKSFTFAAMFITSCLLATAIYIDFNDVGSLIIAGCQPRYLLPMLFPVFYVIGSNRISHRFNKTIYNISVVSAMAFINLYNLTTRLFINFI